MQERLTTFALSSGTPTNRFDEQGGRYIHVEGMSAKLKKTLCPQSGQSGLNLTRRARMPGQAELPPHGAAGRGREQGMTA